MLTPTTRVSQSNQWSFTIPIKNDKKCGMILTNLSVVIEDKTVEFIAHTKKNQRILGYIRTTNRPSPPALEKIVGQTTTFQKAPPKVGRDILVEIQMSPQFWEAGKLPRPLTKFLMEISKLQTCIRCGMKLNELVRRFPKTCPKYPIIVQTYIDEVGCIITEDSNSRRAISAKVSTNKIGRTLHSTLVRGAPENTTTAPAPLETCENPEAVDASILRFSNMIETLPDKVMRADEQGVVYQPSPEELKAMERVVLKEDQKEKLSLFNAWKKKMNSNSNNGDKTD